MLIQIWRIVKKLYISYFLIAPLVFFPVNLPTLSGPLPPPLITLHLILSDTSRQLTAAHRIFAEPKRGIAPSWWLVPVVY